MDNSQRIEPRGPDAEAPTILTNLDLNEVVGGRRATAATDVCTAYGGCDDIIWDIDTA